MNRPPGALAAYAALRRGTDFVRASALRNEGSTSPKVAGNTLAELDRLLHVLISQTAIDRRIRLPARSRDNAIGLAVLCGGGSGKDRLRALSRSTACLRRHGGRATHADRRGCGSMTVGWSNDAAPSSSTLHEHQLGESIMPSAAQMGEVCAFYDRLARGVVGVNGAIRRTSTPLGRVRLAA